MWVAPSCGQGFPNCIKMEEVLVFTSLLIMAVT